MKKSRFLALAMCCAFLAGMPAKAMKDSPAESGNRNKVLDSAVNLVKENPVKSFFAILFGSVLEEGIRRGCKKSKSSEIKSNIQINNIQVNNIKVNNIQINNIQIDNKVPGLPKVQVPFLPKAPVTDVNDILINDILKGFKFRQPKYKSYLKLVGDLAFFPKSFKDFINSKKDELRYFFDSGLGHYVVYGKSIFLSDEVVNDILSSEAITGRKLNDEEKALIKSKISFVICPSKSYCGPYDPDIPNNKYLKDSRQWRNVNINFMYVEKENEANLIEYDKQEKLDMCRYLKYLCYFDYDEMKKCEDITIFDDIKQYWATHEYHGKVYVA